MDPGRQRKLIEHLTRSHDRLFSCILALLGNREDAEDVLQRTRLVIWKKFDRFEGKVPVANVWLSLLEIAGIEQKRFADSTGTLTGLRG